MADWYKTVETRQRLSRQEAVARNGRTALVERSEPTLYLPASGYRPNDERIWQKLSVAILRAMSVAPPDCETAI